jgi:hypothetical protein
MYEAVTPVQAGGQLNSPQITGYRLRRYDGS